MLSSKFGLKIDRFLVDIFQQRMCDACETRFRISVCGRWIAVNGSEVALTIDQRITHGEWLCHSNQCVVDGHIAVGMKFAEDVTNNAGAFFCGPVEIQTHLAHRIQNAAMYRLQTITNVGQRAPDDDAHRVVEIRPAHLLFDIYGADIAVVVPAARRYETAAVIGGKGVRAGCRCCPGLPIE